MINFIPDAYLAFVLSDESRKELLNKFEPKFSRIICHHVTIEFNPTKEFIKNFDMFDAKAFVYGYAQGKGVECLTIKFNKIKNDYNKGARYRKDGSFYHITLSVEPPHKPVESNMLKDHIRCMKGNILITGEFKLIKKGQ